MNHTQRLMKEAYEKSGADDGKPSWNRVRTFLNADPGNMRKWRAGEVVLNDVLALKISVFLNYSPQLVMAWLNVDRAKDDIVKAQYQALADTLEHNQNAFNSLPKTATMADLESALTP